MKLRDMRVGYRAVAACLGLVWAGCSSPASRISHNRNEFNSYPAEVQAKIRAGDVAIGFTAPQVKMALGEPDRIYTRTTAKGSSEVWVYRGKRNPISVGFGFGMFTGGASAVGAGVSTESFDPEDTMRVVFADGRVSALERPLK